MEWNSPPLRDRILSFWRAGLDTQSIAKAMQIPEYEVYNRLISYLSEKRKAA